MWRKFDENEYGDYGFVRLISDDYTKWTDNAEVILIDHFPKAKEGEVKRLVTRWMIRFTEHFSDGNKEDEFNELKEEYTSHYGKEPKDIYEIAFYCADGLSRWGAIERIENPSDEDLVLFLSRNQVELNFRENPPQRLQMGGSTMSGQPTKWNDGTFYIEVKIEKGKPKGSVYNSKTGKTWTLSEFASEEADSPFPGEVSQNFHRILSELNINKYTGL